ncbi:hypothetical protein [Vibrio hepatarius]|jgi:hypothetical protein|uniref:Uncharacterized protein n=1 Tax=Vibrio hepatarius TaxID=171383 RepID=A0A0M0HVQ9_9VIBR|nr:hypothetical protein [Vibrio hepatarius]KOO05718.1 hypothetical protein AKJ31_20720 [Vibrio hepatarius]
MNSEYYQHTAFNSRKRYHLSPESGDNNLLKKFLKSGSRKLPFSNPTNEISTRVDLDNKPGLIERLREIKPELEPFWDHNELVVERPSHWFHAYSLLSIVLGKGVILILLPLTLVVSGFLGLLIPDVFNEFLFPSVKWVFIPAAILWLQLELMDRGYWTPTWIMTSKKVFTLNRKTGMVTLYKGNGKVRYSHPLVEFDCVLVSAPSQQGLMNYSLMLVHRYNGSMHGVPLSSLATPNESVSEYYRIWNMILCYMDISQPLPDCLILEESRHLDPVTAEYDKKTGRNPRYWRDMSEEEYKATLEAIRNKQQGKLETGPELDIFAEIN